MSKILVLGDTCLDINYYGNIHKISPEAPIPIFSIESKEEIPGMAGNVIRNLENAGNEVISYTKDLFLYSPTIKSRYFAGKHYLYRIDDDNTKVLNEKEQSIILGFIKKLTGLKAVILQDYNKGFFTNDFIRLIIEIIRLYSPQTIIIADGHKSRHPSFYCNVDYLKLNKEEYSSLMDKGTILNYIVKAIIVTKGEDGSSLIYRNHTKDFPAIKVEAIDVTGAGDTFTSWFASELAKGKTEEEAMTTASKAASISVEYLGCYAPTEDEVNEKK